MTVIESEVIINKPVEQVYAFLANMNNHEQLMPPNIYNWTSTEDEANFTIQNMAKLSLKISNKVENQELTALPVEKVPFDIELKWTVAPTNESGTLAKLMISADLNPMMKMIATSPLQKLVNHQTEKLKEVMG